MEKETLGACRLIELLQWTYRTLITMASLSLIIEIEE